MFDTPLCRQTLQDNTFFGAANGTFGAVIIVGDGLHRCVFPVVFQSDEEFITDGQVGRVCFIRRLLFCPFHWYNDGQRPAYPVVLPCRNFVFSTSLLAFLSLP